ncbi:MAG: sugar kinase [Acidobacteria bacterium]|nr:sugar kinase [Acidobacteriota bacterium]MCH8985245.1 sugar kinase [Acidobacteriota bacterium]
MTVSFYDHLVGYGEAMVRLSTPVGETLELAPTLSAHVGGAELNGLITATVCGMPGTWISAVGDDTAGRRITRHVEAFGVGHRLQIINGARTGLYFVEIASYPRPTRVFYDRVGSAASQLDRGMIDWGDLLGPTSCFYSTGVTAAISESSRASLEEAFEYAAEVGATVAFDINYRSKLWSKDDAYDWMNHILPVIDILSVSNSDLDALGLRSDNLTAAREALGVAILLVTTKRRSAASITVTVRAIQADSSYETSGEALVVDPFGAGDAMMGAFLARLPATGLEAAVDSALGAALSAYGLYGDAMSVDPTTPACAREILR